MYQGTSELFNQIIKNSARTFRARMINTADTSEIIDRGFRKLTISKLSNEDKRSLSIGGITASELEVEIDGISRVITGKEFDVQIGLLTDIENKTYEWVSIGKYTAQKPTTRAYMTKFTAYDRFVSKLGGLYSSSLTYPASGKAILDEIATLSGVGIITDGLPDIMFPLKTVTGSDGEITSVDPFEGFTYRETIGYVAMAYGKFATVNRDGNVELRWYTDTNYRIEKNMSYDDIEVANSEYSVDYLNVIVNNDRNNPMQQGQGLTGVSVATPIFTSEMLEYAFGQINGFAYTPTTLSFKGDPRIDLGDIVTVVNNDNTEIKVPIMSLEFDFDGGLICKVGSYGDTEQSNKAYASSPNANRMDRMYTELLILNQAIANKVTAEYVEAHYVATSKLDAVQADITQAVIRDLETEFLTADEADIKYANIELSNIAVADVGRLFADVGLITDLVVKDGHITGVLDSVTINANNITSGTLTTDRLVIRGTDKSIVYELNNISGALQAKEVDTLNGEIITPRTINADRIVANSITSGELNVNEIFANSAIIKKIFSEDVEATGTITGATLKGAYAEITNGFIGGFDIKNNFLGFLESAPYQDLTTSEEKMSHWYSFMIRPESYNNTFAPTTKVFWLGAHPGIIGGGYLDEDGFYDESKLDYPLYFTADGGAYFSKGKIGRWEIVNSTSLVGTFDAYNDATGILAQFKSESTGEITGSTRLYHSGIVVDGKSATIDDSLSLTRSGISGTARTVDGTYVRETKFIDIIQTTQKDSSNNVVGIRTELDLSADIINLKAQPYQASGVMRVPPVINTDMELRNGLDVYAYYNDDDRRVSLRGLADSKVSKSGDTMTGDLTVKANINTPLLSDNSDTTIVTVPTAGTVDIGSTDKGITDVLTSYKSFIGSIHTKTAWNSIISARHRNGYSDGSYHGMYLRSLMNRGNADLIWNNQTAGTWENERTILDSRNYSSYTVSKTSGTATGTSFSITLNAYSTYLLSVYNSMGMSAVFVIGATKAGSFKATQILAGGSYSASVSGTTVTISGSGLSASTTHTYKYIELK